MLVFKTNLRLVLFVIFSSLKVGFCIVMQVNHTNPVITVVSPLVFDSAIFKLVIFRVIKEVSYLC